MPGQHRTRAEVIKGREKLPCAYAHIPLSRRRQRKRHRQSISRANNATTTHHIRLRYTNNRNFHSFIPLVLVQHALFPCVSNDAPGGMNNTDRRLVATAGGIFVAVDASVERDRAAVDEGGHALETHPTCPSAISYAQARSGSISTAFYP
ncbi:hypothetical protein M422DRAFT_270316 [Sphaerobolus stellatus SS14]|uniref:Uncharacterized protein n=1 Tax=Sphaerobolus stellatus (strain SS14) TaxID=990650 RepID=A0A0C9UST4_SPHS4|nr:hypothetical protein M422DRAFT_270316 [Sphaerobolus stellatus SS14]